MRRTVCTPARRGARTCGIVLGLLVAVAGCTREPEPEPVPEVRDPTGRTGQAGTALEPPPDPRVSPSGPARAPGGVPAS